MTLSEKNHIKSINKALLYIEEHLEHELSLTEISNIAHYSPYHFHRIFKAFTKETLNHYIARKRVEKASADLLHRDDMSISELSTRYGFTSNSSFTRAFKKFYGMSPSHFRSHTKGKYSKIRQVKSKNGQPITVFEDYVCQTTKKNDIGMKANIEVKTINSIHTAGITCIGKQQLPHAFNRVLEWAGQKGLLRQPDFKMATIFYDSFKITAADKVRMTASIVLEQALKSNGEINATKLNGGSYIIGHYEIGIEEFPIVWTNLFKWMNDNGYKKKNQPPFEIYHNDFNQHSEKKCIVDLYIPVI
ncbi:transcriptional regulator, AraC family [Formosa sp. Hel1_31_208]|uniref:AraC family transcriptional regulator n=1 Tax=Formosa sp. Hel1_31_208 TaxID=1798225 RepID=UPI00087AC1B5|nr:AraC family transcriptional regulator [Formosa sp. Hel1_31_208]SDS14123.1 transcriptional regulator, AraC family [Formosa sp. Hel1_31_208]